MASTAELQTERLGVHRPWLTGGWVASLQLDPSRGGMNLVAEVIINVLGGCYLFQELNINNRV